MNPWRNRIDEGPDSIKEVAKEALNAIGPENIKKGMATFKREDSDLPNIQRGQVYDTCFVARLYGGVGEHNEDWMNRDNEDYSERSEMIAKKIGVTDSDAIEALSTIHYDRPDILYVACVEVLTLQEETDRALAANASF